MKAIRSRYFHGLISLSAAILTTALICFFLFASKREQEALRVLRENRQAMLDLSGFAAKCESKRVVFTGTNAGQRRVTIFYSQLTAVRQDRFTYEMVIANTRGDYRSGCDGRTAWTLDHAGAQTRTAHRANAPLYVGMAPWGGFFTGKDSLYSNLKARSPLLGGILGSGLESCRVIGRTEIDGVPCDVIAYRYASRYLFRSEVTDGTVYVGPDRLIRRHTIVWRENGKLGVEEDHHVRNIRVNFPTPAASTFSEPVATNLSSPKDS